MRIWYGEATEPAEPTLGQMQLDFLRLPALRPQAVAASIGSSAKDQPMVGRSGCNKASAGAAISF